MATIYSTISFTLCQFDPPTTGTTPRPTTMSSPSTTMKDDLKAFDASLEHSISIRVATFNVENLDFDPVGFDKEKDAAPSFHDRLAVLRPQLYRLRADVLALQEVHSQNGRLDALFELIKGSPYEKYNVVCSTAPGSGVNGAAPRPMSQRNLVILSRFKVLAAFQLKNEMINMPMYRRMTSIPEDTKASNVVWERPVIYALLDVDGVPFHCINLHLKSQHPTLIPGRTTTSSGYSKIRQWNNCAAWSEGALISGMKRLGQAVEARLFIDTIFDQTDSPYICAMGDFNEGMDSVPVQALCGDEALKTNPDLGSRVLVHCSLTVAPERRFTLYHNGVGVLTDHILVSRPLLMYYRNTEIHNEFLRDKSVRSPSKFPESDHAPLVTMFVIPKPKGSSSTVMATSSSISASLANIGQLRIDGEGEGVVEDEEDEEEYEDEDIVDFPVVSPPPKTRVETSSSSHPSSHVHTHAVSQPGAGVQEVFWAM